MSTRSVTGATPEPNTQLHHGEADGSCAHINPNGERCVRWGSVTFGQGRQRRWSCFEHRWNVSDAVERADEEDRAAMGAKRTKSVQRTCELDAIRDSYEAAFIACTDAELRGYAKNLCDAADKFAGLHRLACAKKAMRLAVLMVGGQ